VQCAWALAVEGALPLFLYLASPAPDARASAMDDSLACGNEEEDDDADDPCTRHKTCIDPRMLMMPSDLMQPDAAPLQETRVAAAARKVLASARARRAHDALALATTAATRGLQRAGVLPHVVALYVRTLAASRNGALVRRARALAALCRHVGGGVGPARRIDAASAESTAARLALWLVRASRERTRLSPIYAGFAASYCTMPEGAIRPVGWVAASNNTRVVLGPRSPLFEVGTIDRPTDCSAHTRAGVKCPESCLHAAAMARIAPLFRAAWPTAFEVEDRCAVLLELARTDALTPQFAQRARDAVNAALNRRPESWERAVAMSLGDDGDEDNDVCAYPIDLFAECPVDVFVMVRADARGMPLPHSVAVSPRFDIEDAAWSQL
jgi:hypothetical protein